MLVYLNIERLPKSVQIWIFCSSLVPCFSHLSVKYFKLDRKNRKLLFFQQSKDADHIYENQAMFDPQHQIADSESLHEIKKWLGG